MDREIGGLMKNKIWTPVDKPPGDKKVIDVKWIYQKKIEKEFKARLVVRGFRQNDCVTDAYSPVAKMTTLKLLLSKFFGNLSNGCKNGISSLCKIANRL